MIKTAIEITLFFKKCSSKFPISIIILFRSSRILFSFDCC